MLISIFRRLAIIWMVFSVTNWQLAFSYSLNIGKEDNNHLNSSIQDTSESDCIVLTEDFNLPVLEFPTTAGGPLENSFCDLIGANFPQQFIPGPTHDSGNKLDLLCNCPEVVRMLKRLIQVSANSQPIIISSNFRSNLKLQTGKL